MVKRLRISIEVLRNVGYFAPPLLLIIGVPIGYVGIDSLDPTATAIGNAMFLASIITPIVMHRQISFTAFFALVTYAVVLTAFWRDHDLSATAFLVAFATLFPLSIASIHYSRPWVLPLFARPHRNSASPWHRANTQHPRRRGSIN